MDSTLPSSQAHVVKCSHCGSTHVRLSRRSSGQGSHVTYRCQSCKRHFRVYKVAGFKRTYVVGAIVWLCLVAMGIGVLLVQDSDEVDYQPKINAQDSDALARVKLLADRGDPQAQYDLGWTHWQRDEFQPALRWIKAAADKGQVEAEYLMSMAHMQGRGTVQNYKTSLDWLAKAANHGHIEAQYRLGIFYRDGLGTEVNKEFAYQWLNVAAARGHADATLLRDKLGAVMRADELIRAQEGSSQTMVRLTRASERTE